MTTTAQDDNGAHLHKTQQRQSHPKTVAAAAAVAVAATVMAVART